MYDPVISKIDFEGKDVFEIGSGFGNFSLEYLLNAKSVFGLDTSQEAVEHLEKNWPESREDQQTVFQQGDILEISLEENEYDIVVFSKSF